MIRVYRLQAGLGLILLWLGLFAPLMTVEKLFFFKDTYSIITAIVALCEEGQRVLAAIIAAFSIAIPTLKLLGVLIAPDDPSRVVERRIISRFVGLIGKWSMLDVFIVALTIFAMKANGVVEVFDHAGVYLFGASVALSMLSAMGLQHELRKAPVGASATA
ncbi:MAG: paraquat-inducible protein A [Maricaulaceae bacterium]